MDVNEHEKLFNFYTKSSNYIKEHYFYCCSTFDSHSIICIHFMIINWDMFVLSL